MLKALTKTMLNRHPEETNPISPARRSIDTQRPYYMLSEAKSAKGGLNTGYWLLDTELISCRDYYNYRPLSEHSLEVSKSFLADFWCCKLHGSLSKPTHVTPSEAFRLRWTSFENTAIHSLLRNDPGSFKRSARPEPRHNNCSHCPIPSSLVS